MRLEPEFWNALGEIARREKLTLDALCTRVDAGRGKHSRTAAMRLFAVAYFMTDTAAAAAAAPKTASQATRRANAEAD